MARPTKDGIDYFPLDVTFINDIKVKRILRSCGAESIAVLVYVLSIIYREKGYFIEWNSETTFLVADDIRISETLTESVIQKAIEVDFFNKKIFDKYSILTSEGIQLRYLKATERRKTAFIEKRLDLINPNIEEDKKDKNNDKKENIVKKESLVKEKKKSMSEQMNEVVKAWNEIGEINKVMKVSPNTQRYKLLAARINEYGLEKVLKCIENVKKSRFLLGYSESGWKATFDWILFPANFLKTLEGNYNDKIKEVREDGVHTRQNNEKDGKTERKYKIEYDVE